MGKEEIGCDCDVIHEDVVNRVRNNMQEDILYDLADFFRIVGDSTRTKIMWALDEHEMCVCDLAVLLNMTKSAISHQLRVLKEANLVTFRREGKIIYYKLADDHVTQIFERGFEHIMESK
ncbi:MAG: winged helix-turn-helix transcriptional regulator [Clostridia bacterium]|nr:winged helix-turn-helix transcriptional regulator [Clostridia bacterium]